MYGGTLETWAGLDAGGHVLEIGLTIPMISIEKAPAMDGDMIGEMRVDRRILRLPTVARDQTIFDHLDLYFAPIGHGPQRYAQAHYDLHFFSITPAQVRKIDRRDLRVLEPSRLPRGYQEGIPPFGQAADVCVPEMGIHAVSVAEFTGQRGPFEADMLLPHYAGEPISLEPMITRARLLKRQSFGAMLPSISYWSRTGEVPTFFQARFDASSDSYRVVFGGFQPIHPS